VWIKRAPEQSEEVAWAWQSPSGWLKRTEGESRSLVSRAWERLLRYACLVNDRFEVRAFTISTDGVSRHSALILPILCDIGYGPLRLMQLQRKNEILDNSVIFQSN
jgi:hypothetical protein